MDHLPGKPLPQTVVDFQKCRLVPFKRLLNDMVEELLVKCFENDTFKRYLEGTYDEQCVEGSLAADNFRAAEIIRELGKKEKSPVGNEKLATIVKSMGVVLRRYGQSRKERRQTVDGEIVPNGSEE